MGDEIKQKDTGTQKLASKSRVRTITDIAGVLNSGGNDEALNKIITQFIADWGLNTTVAQWRVENFKDLRRWAYPPIEAYNSAVISKDTEAVSEYSAAVLAVDLRFPAVLVVANPAVISGTTIVADSVAEVTLSLLPNPSTVTVQHPGIVPETGIYWKRTNGIFAFRVDAIGPYTLTIDSGPTYEKKIFTVTGVKK